jgi:hypothetical protein
MANFTIELVDDHSIVVRRSPERTRIETTMLIATF